MAEVNREIIHEKGKGTSFIAWVALIVAVLALLVGWMAYNRSGEDLESRIRDQVNSVVNEAQQESEEAQNELNNGN